MHQPATEVALILLGKLRRAIGHGICSIIGELPVGHGVCLEIVLGVRGGGGLRGKLLEVRLDGHVGIHAALLHRLGIAQLELRQQVGLVAQRQLRRLSGEFCPDVRGIVGAVTGLPVFHQLIALFLTGEGDGHGDVAALGLMENSVLHREAKVERIAVERQLIGQGRIAVKCQLLLVKALEGGSTDGGIFKDGFITLEDGRGDGGLQRIFLRLRRFVLFLHHWCLRLFLRLHRLGVLCRGAG